MRKRNDQLIKTINLVLLVIVIYFIVVTRYQHIETQNQTNFEEEIISTQNGPEEYEENIIIISDFNTANIKHAKIIKNNKTNELYLQYEDDDELYPLKNCNIDQ